MEKCYLFVAGSNEREKSERATKAAERNWWQGSPKRLQEVREGHEKLSAQFHDTIIPAKLQLCALLRKLQQHSGIQQRTLVSYQEPSIPCSQTPFQKKRLWAQLSATDL